MYSLLNKPRPLSFHLDANWLSKQSFNLRTPGRNRLMRHAMGGTASLYGRYFIDEQILR